MVSPVTEQISLPCPPILHFAICPKLIAQLYSSMQSLRFTKSREKRDKNEITPLPKLEVKMTRNRGYYLLRIHSTAGRAVPSINLQPAPPWVLR